MGVSNECYQYTKITFEIFYSQFHLCNHHLIFIFEVGISNSEIGGVWIYLGVAVAYWLGCRIQDRNEDFDREFDSRWWILFRKFEILSKSCTITVVIIYRCYPVTPSRQQPKYALGASGPLAMSTNYKQYKMLSESCTITAVINYRCFSVTPSRQQPKYAIGASGPLAMGTNLKKIII